MLKTPGNFWEIGEGPCGPDSRNLSMTVVKNMILKVWG